MRIEDEALRLMLARLRSRLEPESVIRAPRVHGRCVVCDGETIGERRFCRPSCAIAFETARRRRHRRPLLDLAS